MKKFYISFLLLSLTLGAGFVNAQNDKAAEKEWAKKLKALKPLEYKKLVEEKESMQSELSDSKAKLAHYQKAYNAQEEQLSRLEKELEDYKSGTVAAPAKVEVKSASAAAPKSVPVQGLVYKVQIGAFKNKDLTKYLNNHKNFSGEIDSDGSRKYTLGHFTEYWEANNFKKYLREMGVKDAWIVPYKDGKRVSLKDALEGAL